MEFYWVLLGFTGGLLGFLRKGDLVNSCSCVGSDSDSPLMEMYRFLFVISRL